MHGHTNVAGIASLALWIGALIFAGGVVRLMLAFRLRPAKGWGWVLFDAILSIIVGSLIARGWPGSSIAFIGLLAGFWPLFAALWRIMPDGRRLERREGTLSAGAPRTSLDDGILRRAFSAFPERRDSMTKSIPFAVSALLSLLVSVASAQPTEGADQAARSINPYVYMRDGAGNKVFIETRFWRNDPNYDTRSLKRISDVMSGLEKAGFKASPEAANGWDKPEKVVRCRINLEVVNKRWRGKTGALVSCEGTGISEAEVVPSENGQHAKLVLDAFDKQFKIAKEKLAR